jgi:hypothetical protein
MKIYNKLIALVAAFGLVGVSYAQDAGKISDNLSLAGFVDASYNSTEDGGAQTDNIGIDEVEIDFLFGFGSVSAEVHVDSTGGNLSVEQAFATYDLGNGFSVALGKYGSSLGLEREDPAGLYTYSRAYGGTNANALNVGNADVNVGEGIAVNYSADDFSIRVSFEDGENTNIDGDSLDTEVSVSYTGIENLTIGGGIQSGNGADDGDTTVISGTYTAGKALIGAEYIDAENVSGGANDADAYMLLVDYDVNEKLGVALRYAEVDEDGGVAGDYEGFTIAPNYAITENLGAILEYTDGERAGATDVETLALELTLTF